LLGADSGTVYSAVGCDQCNQTGYRGRTGIYELLTVGEHVRQMIHEQDTEEAILQSVRPRTTSFRDDGIARVRQGLTTIEDVLRVTQED
jgi:general secretion pathway protein E